MGIVRVANEHMARALRVISVQRGLDPRDYTLTSFGGAGGLHMCALADALGMRRALVPVHAGVLSALGMLVTFLTVLYVLAVHVVTFAMSRFRLPLEPFLAAGAALAVTTPGPLLAGLRQGRRRLATGALLLVLAACWTARVGAMYYEPPGPGSPELDEAALGDE